MPHIKAILFDCDNTLVKSEEIAFQACAGLANEILEEAGKTERYTGPTLLSQFVGQNFRGMLKGLAERHGLKLDDAKVDEYVDRELGEVIRNLRSAPVQPCEGVLEALADIAKPGPDGREYELAVVSSSAGPRVEAALEVVQIDGYFGERVYSAATSLPAPTSKPNPAVYLYSTEQLGRKAAECVAIEDSRSGATAAKRAGIPLIGYVGVYDDPHERQEAVEMLKDVGAIAIMNHWSELRECLRKVDAAPEPEPYREEGKI